MSGSAKAGTTAERHTCELRRSGLYVLHASPKRASAEVCFLLTIDYMDVGYVSGNLGIDAVLNGRQALIVHAEEFLYSYFQFLPPAFPFLSSKARLYLPLASRPEDRTPLQRHSGGNVTE